MGDFSIDVYWAQSESEIFTVKKVMKYWSSILIMTNESDSNKCCKYVIEGIRCQSGNLMKLKLCFFSYRKLATMWIINIYIKPPRDCNSLHATHICFLRMEFEICNFGVENFHCGRIVWWLFSLSDQEPFAIFHKWAGWPIRCKRNSLTNISHHKP